MRIPSYRKIQKADSPDVPDDVFRVLVPVSDQVDILSRACQRRLTASENLGWEVRDLPLYHDTEVEVSLQGIRGFPRGLWVVWTELNDYWKWKWRPVDTRTVALSVYWDSTPSAAIDTRIVVMGG